MAQKKLRCFTLLPKKIEMNDCVTIRPLDAKRHIFTTINYERPEVVASQSQGRT